MKADQSKVGLIYRYQNSLLRLKRSRQIKLDLPDTKYWATVSKLFLYFEDTGNKEAENQDEVILPSEIVSDTVEPDTVYQRTVCLLSGGCFNL